MRATHSSIARGAPSRLAAGRLTATIGGLFVTATCAAPPGQVTLPPPVDPCSELSRDVYSWEVMGSER